jgi:hypothetical protein
MLQRPIFRATVLGIAMVLLAGVHSAQAQVISRIGDTKVAYPKSPAARFPDVAYDPLHNVYLVVSGQQPIEGRFVDSAGNPLGASFRVSPSTGVIAARIDFNRTANAFIVTWIDEGARVATDDVIGARLLRWNGSGPEFISGELSLGGNGVAKHTESAPSVACTTNSNECLVTWAQWANPWDVWGQRVDAGTGALVGGPIPIGTGGNWDALPSIAFNSSQNEYFVVHTSEAPNGIMYTVGERIQAGTGAHLGRSTLYGKAGLNNYPEVAYNSRGNLYMVITWAANASGDVWGMLADGNGNPAGPVIPVAANPFFEGGDGIGIAYNPGHDGFFAVFQGPSSDTLGVEMNGLGIPTAPVFRAMVSSAGKDIFQPQVAGSTAENRYLIATSVDFNRVSVQLMGGVGGPGQPPPPPPDPPVSAPIDLTPQGAPNGSWFLSEGSAGTTPTGFSTYYLIANENPVPVSVRAYFAREDGFTYAKTYNVGAASRLTLDLRAEVGSGNFGAIFQSLTPGNDIYAERSMYWGNDFEGSTSEVATKSLSNEWFFAEASCGCNFWNNFFLLFNPNPTPATVAVIYRRDNGGPVVRSVVVGPQSRLTIFANEVPELQGSNFGTSFNSNIPIVAERAMYWGSQWLGGTASMGARAPSSNWVFAEGAAMPGFDTFFLLMNPTSTPTTVTATFVLDTGQVIQKTYPVAPDSRVTVWMNDALGQVGGAAAQFFADSGVPIIAERSIYWAWQGTDLGWVEGSNVMGTPQFANEWHIPEGSTTGSFEDFLLVYNPNEFGVTLNVTMYTEANGAQTALVTVAPRTRGTFYMHNLLQAAGLPRNASFATRVQAQNGAMIAVEHAQYRHRDDPNYWRAGAASFGIPK